MYLYGFRLGKDLVNLLLYREAQIGDPREMKKKPALINHFLFAFNGVSVVVIDIVDLCLAILDRLVRNLNDRELKLIQNLNICNILNMFTMSKTGALTLLPIKCIRINGNQSMNGRFVFELCILYLYVLLSGEWNFCIEQSMNSFEINYFYKNNFLY